MWRAIILAACLVGLSRQEGFVPMVLQNFDERVNIQLQQQISSYVTQEIAYKAYAAYYERADVALPGFQKFFSSLAKDAAKHARSLTDLVNSRGGRVRFPVIQVKDACESIRNEIALGAITKNLDPQSVSVTARRDPHICYFQLVNNPFTSKKRKEKSYFTKPSTSQVDREWWLEGLYGLEDALALEKATRAEITSVLTTAKAFRDPQIRHQLKQYLSSQTKSVYRVASLLQRLQPHQALDSYHLEQYLLDEELQS